MLRSVLRQSKQHFVGITPKNNTNFFVETANKIFFSSATQNLNNHVATTTTTRNPTRMASKDPLVWVDCEMGGLDIDVHNILEIAVIITDSELNTIAEHDTLYIHQTEEQIAQFDPWCVEQHGKSGLTELVRSSKTSIEDADNQIYDFLKKHIPQARVACLAGNTVHIDKRFMDKLMPKTMSHLHYRIVDVSSLKELARRWYPEELAKAPKKKGKHRALDDIKESIAELKYYRSVIFKQPTTSLRRHGK